MASENMCIVEGCDQEYDVTCSFSFFNGHMTTDDDALRQEWIENAVSEDSECHWRNVSLKLCGYHFESDEQSLWVESPMLAEVLAAQPKLDANKIEDQVKLEHNYSAGAIGSMTIGDQSCRLNVRKLMESLGYLSLKQLQRKHLWVVGVDPSDHQYVNIIQSEQVITKMPDPNNKQIIELIPPPHVDPSTIVRSEILGMEGNLPENFIYEIAGEQEVRMVHSDDIPLVQGQGEWTLNIIPDSSKPKYAFIKHTNSGKKKKHFATNVQVLEDEHRNTTDLYIIPDVDPGDGVEVSTSYTNEMEISPYEHLVLETTKPRRPNQRKIRANVRDQIRKIKKNLKDEPQEDMDEDVGDGSMVGGWEVYQPHELTSADELDPSATHQEISIEEHSLTLGEPDLSSDDPEEDRKGSSRVRRKNKKYFTYDYVT